MVFKPLEFEGWFGVFIDDINAIYFVMNLLHERALQMEEAMEALLDTFLEKKDPVRKAVHNSPRKVTSVNTTRRQIPTPIKHEVNRRDHGKCQAPDCSNQFWTEVHHKVPYSRGGKHTEANLITLSAHLEIQHQLPI